ncbi:unnamed protein product (macronuclear) [Paramecium tetraurelia]|uniref:Uncharacterized protein n=1 Tax=Paramecium tetraurelia TaxID=5888 RepID=A0C967_PARTE|nr:uncharacterized protein GSPATT00006640001 [Paramecium tetraurelia]CAK67334.1 unnamed protein product [Paramecium tetraurelia]|eukprot:XP_001434731.1 hypothetical protein (macronuclear) [Paramecium tetraurelia strain d4-2]
MIKHHLKFKIPKQEVIQVKNQTKSSFYITRRIIQTNSDNAIHVMNNKVVDQVINHKKKNPVSSRAYTISHYRSYSTTPTNIKGQQQSQNLDEQVQFFNSERQQSISVLSSQFKIATSPKPIRVVSLYQISPLQEPKSNPLVYQDKQYFYSQFHSAKIVNFNQQDQKFNQNDDDFICQNSFIMNKRAKNKSQIFVNVTYKDFEKKSKYVYQQNQQGTQKQQIFLQKVLKIIKDSQNDKSDPKLLVSKFSKIWKENFSPKQFQEQQKYSQSTMQFKWYFNQFIEKILNQYRLYQYINKNLEFIETKKNNQLQVSVHELRRFYIKNHNNKITHTQIEDQQFRYKKEIISFGMIDILIEIKDEEFQSEYFQQNSQREIAGKKLEYFYCEKIQDTQQYQISPIISKLDNQSKNELLSVDYTEMDKIMNQSKKDQFVPKIQLDNVEIRRFNSKITYIKYSDIIMGNYKNNNEIVDLEHDNYQEYQQQQATLNMDKKAMMMNLRKQTRRTKVSVSSLQKENEIIQKQFMAPGYRNNLLASEQQPKMNMKRSQTKSIHSIAEREIDQSNEIIYTNETNKGNAIFKCYRENFQPVKYQQQLKLQNLQMFENTMRHESSSIALVQMMIEHNFIEELIDYNKKNPNFSLNSRNAYGTPLIMVAAQSGNKELVQYMINQNVLLNVKDLEGNTALHYAIRCGYYEIADLLLLNGANQELNI